MPDLRTDSELARAALLPEDGTSAADEIVRRHHEAVYRFLLRLTGRREDAEDLTQETFLRAFRKLKTFRAGHPLQPWLFTIGRRLTLMHWRKQKPSSELFDKDFIATPDANLHDSTELWKLARKQLRKDHFIALWLHYQEDYSVREIAQVLRKTTPHTKVILHRARKALRLHLSTTNDNWLPEHPINSTI